MEEQPVTLLLVTLGVLYFGSNALYTGKRYNEEGGLTAKQIGIGLLAGIPILVGVVLLVWGLPTIMPEKFHVGGGRIKHT